MMNKRNIAIFVGMAIAGAIAGSTLGVPSGVSAQTKAVQVGMASAEKVQHEGKNGHGKNMEEVAAILKLTKEELRTQVRSGKTLAQIATTQKVDIKLVIDSIVTNIKTYIAEELASGEITQAEADKKLANVTTKVTEMVNNLPPARGERGSKTRSESMEEVAAILKLTKEELRTQVESGKTLAQIATAQKVDIKLVINSIVASIKTHIAEEVTSGEMTQAEADKKLANVTTKVTEMVNNLPPARGERGSKTRSES